MSVPMTRLDRDETITIFELQLGKARNRARLIAVQISVTRFLGFCSLAWATAVLLGGFVADLSHWDFYIVSSLLLFEAGRISTVVSFSGWVTRNLVNLSQDPKHLPSYNSDKEKKLIQMIRTAAVLVQAFFIAPGIVLPVWSLIRGHYWGSPQIQDASLCILYLLSLINATVATLSVASSVYVYVQFLSSSSESIQKYYDEVLWRALDSNIFKADDFQVFNFLFQVQSQAYSHNARPEDILKRYDDVFEYLYAHRSGVEAVLTNLDSDDCFKQRAAVCIVGSWADKELVKLPAQLLTKVADKIGIGEIGFAAAISFSRLASTAPDLVLRTANSQGKSVVYILIDTLDVENSLSTLSCMRALIKLLEKRREKMQAEWKEKLVVKLRQAFEDDSSRPRIRTLAGFGLHLIGSLTEVADSATIGSIDPVNSKDTFFHKIEQSMLDELRSLHNLPPYAWDALKPDGSVFEILDHWWI